MRKFLIIIVLALITSCTQNEGNNYTFRYDISVNPRTLDPQTATGKTSALLISNLYDGLLQVNKSGNIIANIAAEYFISDDGLTYTFLLRDDVYWYYNGDYSIVCTARDFVFAFQRLFNPAVKSDNAQLFYSIKNAEKVHKGEIPELDVVGIDAISDYELIITLEYPNPLLPYLLTTTPAMPCNEELFNKTDGRYGLNEKFIPSNGAFYISRWNYDPYSDDNNVIIMRRNTKNSETNMIYPRGLNFFINYNDPLGHFLEGTTHSLIAESNEVGILISKEYPYDSFENSVWGVAFNTSRSRPFRNEDLRTALATGFDRNNINITGFGFRSAEDLIPPLISLNGEPYRKTAGSNELLEFNHEAAKVLYEKGAKVVGYENLSGLSVIMPESEVSSTAFEYMSRIMQQWQLIGFFCKIEFLPEEAYIKALADGDFDIVMVKLTGEFNSPDAYLNQFGTYIKTRLTEEFNELLTEARRTSALKDSAVLFKQAEDLLIKTAVFVPVCYQTELFFYNNKSSDLVYNPFTGIINYRYAKYIK